MKEITMEKIEALQNNEEFTSQMAAAKTMDDVLKTMNDNGIELTKEELEAGYEEVLNRCEEKGYANDGELTEEGLELVSGGFFRFHFMSFADRMGMYMAGPNGRVSLLSWAGGCALSILGFNRPRRF